MEEEQVGAAESASPESSVIADGDEYILDWIEAARLKPPVIH